MATWLQMQVQPTRGAKPPPPTTTINNNDVLLSMRRTGKYVPSGSWVIPYSGQGMDKQQANSARLMMTSPAEVRLQDVDNAFFGGITNQRYFEVDAKNEPDLLQVHDGILLPKMSVGPSPEEVVSLRKMNANMLIHTTDI